LLSAVDNSEIVDSMNAAIRQTEDKAKFVLKAVEDEYHRFILDNIAKHERLAQDAVDAKDNAVANRSRIMAAVYRSMLDSFVQSRRYPSP
jgi:hypothetical protein